ncbi:hypothetical protein D9M71_230120 [compost metagenome]
MADNPQLHVTGRVTRGDQRVVHTGSGVLGEREDFLSFVGEEAVTLAWVKLQPERTAVLHRHSFGEVCRVKGPSVHNLLAMGVYEFDGLPLFQPDRYAPSCRQTGQFTGLDRHHCVHAFVLLFSG